MTEHCAKCHASLDTDYFCKEHKLGCVACYEAAMNDFLAVESDSDNAVWVAQLNLLANRLHQAQVEKGFWGDGTTSARGFLDQKLMLIVGEVSEAHEELRSNNDPHHVYYRDDGKPEGFGHELADVLIRTLDLAAAFGIDIGAAVERKHAFNLTRPHKHGRNF